MKRILLIEPDWLLAQTYTKALRHAGYSVVTAAGAQTAITAADQAKPDLVILELQLINHSGIEFLYEFRSYLDWRGIPVVVHSQVPPSEFRDSWELMRAELGVHTYLYKPFTTLRQLLRSTSQFAGVKT